MPVAQSKRIWIRWVFVILGLALLGAGSWVAIRYNAFLNREFTIIKPWAADNKSIEQSVGFEWVHRQCRENLANGTSTGLLKPWAASSVEAVDGRTWKFTLRNDLRWSDDGSTVKSEDFVEAWKFRQGKVEVPEFARIKSLAAIDQQTIEVTLDGSPDGKLDFETLTSIWLTATKKMEGPWSWEKEISSPCYGPFVTQKISKDAITMIRNHNWRDYNIDQMPIVKVILDSPGQSSTESFLRSGLISFTAHPGFEPQSDGKKLFVTRSSIEPTAYYLVVNPKGVFTANLRKFPHLGINRAELSGTISHSQYFNVMYRLLPLTFLNEEASGRASYFPNFNLESHLDARRLLGLKDDQSSDVLRFPRERELRIATLDEERLEPIVERYAARLKANFNIESEVLTMSEDDKQDKSADLMIIGVDLKNGLDQWAKDMARHLKEISPAPSEMIAKFDKVAAAQSGHRDIAAVAGLLIELDAMAPETSVVVPLGQFGTRFLVDGDSIDVAVTGDETRDPDISRARWTKREFKVWSLH